MHYFILLILLGMPMITPLAHGIIQNDNTDTEKVIQNYPSLISAKRVVYKDSRCIYLSQYPIHQTKN